MGSLETEQKDGARKETERGLLAGEMEGNETASCGKTAEEEASEREVSGLCGVARSLEDADGW